MSILSTLFGNYGDDLIRNAATKYGDDVLRAGAKTTAKQAILNQADDVAGMTAKQAAKATAKAGKSTAAQQIAKNEFDDYLTSLGATPTLRKQMANEAYNGVLGKTGMANRFKTLNVDLANVADKSAAGLNAYGKVMNNLYDYMDNAGVGVDLSGLQNSGSKLFTKAQKNRLLQSGLDIDEVLKGTVSANQANDLYKLSRELSLKYKKAGVNNAIDGAIGDQLKTFATQIRDKLDDTASTVSKSFGLKQQLVDAANSIDDIEVARALSGMADDAITASTVRSEMAPYMKMKDFIGLQAPKEKTLNVIGIDTGIANPLPKLSKAAKNTALKAKGALQTENGKNAAIALGAGGLGLLGGLLAGGNNGGNQNMGNMSTLGALTGDSDVVYGGNGINTQVGGKNGSTANLGGNAGNSADTSLTIGGYSYDDLENAYVSAIMAGDSGAADVIADMIGVLDNKSKRLKDTKSSSGTAQKQQAAMDVLNTLMGNFQAQGPISGTLTNVLNSLTGGNYNYQAANYNEQSRGSLAMIIKALGDSGALAEGDVERAMGLIPQITDSGQKAYDKYQKLMSMLQSAGTRELKMSILSQLFSNYGDDVLRGATKTASNYADDFFLRYGDDIARAGADKSDDAMRALLNKRGNKDMVRDAFMAQQVDNPGVDMAKIFREYGGDKPSGRKMIANMLTDSADNPPTLVGYHGVGTEKLKKALDNMDGEIVNPSLQIVNPEVNPGKKYGDIILLGDKDMYFGKGQYGLVDSWGKTNAYSRDVYSPRVPNFVEKNGEKFIEGTRKPYTPANVSDFMNKQGTKAVESNWATPGSVAATQSEQFNKLSDILDAAGQLGTGESNRKAFDDFGEYLAKRIGDYADETGRMGDNRYITIDDIMSEVQDALKGKYQPDDFYGLRTQQGRELLGDIRRQIAGLPTDYFEAKVRRPVGLNEFTGAILPNDYADDTILQALKDAGVPIVGNYDPANMDETLQATLKGLTKGKNRFTTPYMLGIGGLLGGGAILGGLLNGDQNKTGAV